MKRLFVILAALLLATSAWAATATKNIDVDGDGKIDIGFLPTTDFSYETDPASPVDGQIWWNETDKVLRIAASDGIYSFTGTLTEWDTTPEAFSFTDVTNATTNSTYTSAAITVAGTNHAAAIYVSGDASAKYSINNATATAANGTAALGDEVRAVVTSSASDATAVNATVLIGGVSDVWSVTTTEAEAEIEVACNGSITNGDNESFEKGAGEFCTTGWTIDNSAGLNTHNGTWSRCGEASLSLSGSAAIYADFGAGVTTKYVRFYVKTANINDYASATIPGMAKYTGGSQTVGNLFFKDLSGGGTSERLILADDGSTVGFDYTEGDTLRVEVKYEDLGTSSRATMRCWRLNAGSFVQIEKSDGGYDLVYADTADTIRYFQLSGAPGFMFDDVQFGNDWVGGASCAE
jgi:hypothetical protein